MESSDEQTYLSADEQTDQMKSFSLKNSLISALIVHWGIFGGPLLAKESIGMLIFEIR